MIRKLSLMLLALATAIALPLSMADEKKKDEGGSSGKAAKSEKAEKSEKADADEAKSTDSDEGKKKEESKFTAKCPVSGGDASKEQKTAYRDKELYFCCEKCKAAYEADTAKYAAKANHQLVQTKQFVQTKCPLSGGDVNKEQFVRVSGVKVTFCCEKCKGAIESASKDDQLSKVFADEVFTKSFEAKKKGGGKKKGDDSKSQADGEKGADEKKEEPAKK